MGRKILVIDDDADFVGAVCTLLDARGYEVRSAGNGDEGIQTARVFMPYLIMLDVMMTRKTEGFDVARQLKADNALRNIPVLMITGVRKEMNLAFGFEPDETMLPVRMFLEKPVRPEVLLKAIEDHIKK